MAAAMAICQAHALIPGLEPNAARASGQAAMRKAGSAHDRAAADNGPGASAHPKKAGLGEAKKKLGTDLLKLIDGSYLLPGESSDEVIFRMKKRKQYFDKTDAAGAHLKRKSGQAHENLAKVYVGLEDSASTDIIDSYAWKVTGRSEEDRQIANRLAHTACGLARTIGANLLADRIHQLETTSAEDAELDLVELAPLLNEIDEELLTVLNEIQSYRTGNSEPSAS